MRRPEFAWPGSQLAEAPDEFSVFAEDRDASDSSWRRRVTLTAVSLRNQDVAVGREDDVAWLVQRLRRIARRPAFANGHQQLAVRTEFEDLVAFALRVWKFRELLRRGRTLVSHPDVAVLVHLKAVRENHHACAEALDDFAGWIELENRVDGRSGAGISAAAVVRPDAFAVGIEINAGR